MPFGEWQPIETAPKDGTNILVATPESAFVSHYYVSEHYRNGKLGHRSEGWSQTGLWFGKDPEPTHWMPLPALPEQAA